MTRSYHCNTTIFRLKAEATRLEERLPVQKKSGGSLKNHRPSWKPKAGT